MSGQPPAEACRDNSDATFRCVIRTERGPDRGGVPDIRLRAHEDCVPAQARGRADDQLCQAEERDSSGVGVQGEDAQSRGSRSPGYRVLRIDGRPKRSAHPGARPQRGGQGKATGPDEALTVGEDPSGRAKSAGRICGPSSRFERLTRYCLAGGFRLRVPSTCNRIWKESKLIIHLTVFCRSPSLKGR